MVYLYGFEIAYVLVFGVIVGRLLEAGQGVRERGGWMGS